MQRIAILTSLTALVFGYSPPHEGRGGNEFPGGEPKGSVATEIGDKALFVDQMEFAAANPKKPRRKMMGDERTKVKTPPASTSSPSGESIAAVQSNDPRERGAREEKAGLAGADPTATAHDKDSPAAKYDAAPPFSAFAQESSFAQHLLGAALDAKMATDYVTGHVAARVMPAAAGGGYVLESGKTCGELKCDRNAPKKEQCVKYFYRSGCRCAGEWGKQTCVGKEDVGKADVGKADVGKEVAGTGVAGTEAVGK